MKAEETPTPSLCVSFLLQTPSLIPQTVRPSSPAGDQWAAVAGPGACAFEPGSSSEWSLDLGPGFLSRALSPDSLKVTCDGQILNPSGCYRVERRRCWIAQPVSRMVGAGIPGPEIHQLQMPNYLHPRSPRISSCGSLFPWDLTVQMGQDGYWAEPPCLQCHPSKNETQD